AAIFQERCAECHQFAGQGRAFGPDLTGIRLKGKEKILRSILEPGAEVAPEYTTWVAETKAGENLVGIKTDDNLATVTLRRADGTQVVWPRLNLQSIETRRWSLMPTGLEEGLSTEDM